MPYSNSHFEDFQRRRWMRPDAHRWLRPEYKWHLPRRYREYPSLSGSEAVGSASSAAIPFDDAARLCRTLHDLQRDIADLRFHLALRKLARKANFNPNQPRVPAGVPEGGQWTDAGWGSSTPGGRATRDTAQGAGLPKKLNVQCAIQNWIACAMPMASPIIKGAVITKCQEAFMKNSN